MSSTYLSLHCHVVFSTKHRAPLIKPDWREGLHRYMGGTIRGLGVVPESIGGVEDHVHVLLGLRATHGLSDFMRELKKATSVWAVKNHKCAFGWQDGYAAFSVSYSHVVSVRAYIENQIEHHRHCSFGDELKRLMEKNGVQFDPRYLE